MRIGIDLDNTIADFRAVFARIAADKGIGPLTELRTISREELRRRVRRQPDGELLWQAIQAEAYGPAMKEVRPFAGFEEFMNRALDAGVELFIVSHRTEFAAADLAGAFPLHDEARRWLAETRISSVLSGIPPGHVFFETTRGTKLERIRRLELDHFVDDLEEVLLDALFPAETMGHHFSGDKGGLDWERLGELIPGRMVLSAVEMDWVAERLGPIRNVFPCSGGRNAQVGRLMSANGLRAAIKRYPQNPWDEVDRYQRESEALEWLETVAAEFAPRWIAGDPGSRLGIIEWLDGVPVRNPTSADVGTLIAFISSIWTGSETVPHERFGRASAAVMGQAALTGQIRQRLARLRQVDAGESGELSSFLERELLPVFTQALASLPAVKDASGGDLKPEHWKLVPADLGFHNAMRCRGGKIRFFDFEYFGWDDPIRLVADLYLHPGDALGVEAKREILERLMALPCLDAEAGARLDARLPLFALRWCLIALNEFLPERRQARKEAGWLKDGELASGTVESRQLELARGLLEKAGSLIGKSGYGSRFGS